MGCGMWIRKKIVPLILSLLLSISSCVAPALSMPVYADVVNQGAVGLTMIVAASMAAMGVGINAAHNTSQALVDGLSDLIGDVKNNWASDFPDEMDKTSKTITSGSKQETAVWGVNQNGKFFVPAGLEKSIAKALVDNGYTLSAEEQDARMVSSGWKPGDYTIEITTPAAQQQDYHGIYCHYGYKHIYKGNFVVFKTDEGISVGKAILSNATKSGYILSTIDNDDSEYGKEITEYKVYYNNNYKEIASEDLGRFVGLRRNSYYTPFNYVKSNISKDVATYEVNNFYDPDYSLIKCPFYNSLDDAQLAVSKGAAYMAGTAKTKSYSKLTAKDVVVPTVINNTLTLPKGINTLANIMKYTAKDSEAKVEITGAANLTDEESELVIKVTNQSGKSTNEYKIKIVREEDTETSSIEVIKYKDGKVTFYDEDGNNTELSEDEFKERYPDEWKKIEDGTYKFDEDGNIIKVDNGNNNSNEKKSGLPWWAILLIILGIVAVIVVVILIIRKKKLGNKGPKKDKKDTDKVYSYDDEDSDNYEDNSDENTDEENKETVNNNSESPEDIDDYDEEARMINEEDERIKDLALEDSEEENDEDSKFTDDSDEEDATEEIDKALQDLMNTKEYDFKDKK